MEEPMKDGVVINPNDAAAALSQLVADPARVITTPQVVARLSRDFYWYSPVLKAQLDGKTADIVVQPLNTDEIIRVLEWCYANEMPVTTRGAGTGNYGQCVPTAGGVVLDLGLMERIEEITPEGIAVCEPGVKLGALETEARSYGWELRCYPSTVAKASVGGFLGGGSGGIGSVTHGGLRDFNTVRAFDIVTMEEHPRLIHLEGDDIHGVLHAWGTNGIMTRIWLALTPAVEWSQCVVAFDKFDAAFDFGEKIATSDNWKKRLVTVFEDPIPSFFSPIASYAPKGKSLIFFLIASAQCDALVTEAEAAGGSVTLAANYSGLKTQPLLSDYTWNHTTLWAMKADPEWTYLQCGFDPARVREQFSLLKEKYGNDILFHIEFMKNANSVIVPGAIPIVRYSTEERLNEMIKTCLDNGISVANPHINNVEGGGRYRADNAQLMAKYRYDAKGLLNPGKMATFQPHTAPETTPA